MLPLGLLCSRWLLSRLDNQKCSVPNTVFPCFFVSGFRKPVCFLPSKSTYYSFSVTVSNYLFGWKGCQCISTITEWPPEMILALFRCSVVLVLFLPVTFPTFPTVGFRPHQSGDRSIHNSVLKNSDFLSLNLYPAFSSLVRTSISFFVCSSLEPSVTMIISSNHAGCLFSSVWSIFS